MEFANNLKRLMGKEGLTDYRLAKEVGTHPSTIKNWKDGAMPSLEMAAKAAKVLGVTLDDLAASIDEQAS